MIVLESNLGGLIAIGNILFVAGLVLVIGISKTVSFFTRKGKLTGAICFLVGILLVFIKWPIFGIATELFGFINLFADFFPIVIQFLRRVPVIGTFLALPGVKQVADLIAGQRLPV